jgi:molybdopterin-guanine dinucleotide biosynthesis protein A
VKIYGLILAGGRSSRFGSDKAFANLAGVPLIGHIAQSLRASVNALAVSGGREAAAFIGAPVLPDPPGAPRGPLAGIAAGLAWVEAESADWLATTTCDTPLIPGDMVGRLIEAAHARDAELAIVRTSDGLHPLCAVWRPRLRAVLSEILSTGIHPSVRQFATDRNAVEVTFPHREQFFNINTAADLDIAKQYLREPPAHH